MPGTPSPAAWPCPRLACPGGSPWPRPPAAPRSPSWGPREIKSGLCRDSGLHFISMCSVQEHGVYVINAYSIW